MFLALAALAAATATPTPIPLRIPVKKPRRLVLLFPPLSAMGISFRLMKCFPWFKGNRVSPEERRRSDREHRYCKLPEGGRLSVRLRMSAERGAYALRRRPHPHFLICGPWPAAFIATAGKRPRAAPHADQLMLTRDAQSQLPSSLWFCTSISTR
ncbi:MAG: hypothetical protein IIA41_04735 [SAR324 cluster bacterium]|nr:hypothetical protein [SAR324 cluster bacterium]